ncbi:MAG: zinc-finger domain-containing protein [Gammaproteobacteria bacterium]|nr:zinc-finger domain-containing protein [Gammaproteobacteria bacterium]
MEKVDKKQACSNKKQTVRPSDLPLSCPSNTSVLWNAHPKVYLPIDKTGEETCPYCGIQYVLKDD